MARALNALIDGGRLPRPKRSLRFLWVPEWHGTMAYIEEHPEMVGPALGGTYLAHINLDMVGEHLELLHSRMNLTSAPWSTPSALNDVVENMAQMTARLNVRSPRGSLSMMNFQLTPYGGGSDHMMFIDRDIQGMMIGHSDYTHHTSEDTPDKVDPVELERSEIVATTALLYLSDLAEAEAVDLAYLVGAKAAGRLGACLRREPGHADQSGAAARAPGEVGFESGGGLGRGPLRRLGEPDGQHAGMAHGLGSTPPGASLHEDLPQALETQARRCTALRDPATGLRGRGAVHDSLWPASRPQELWRQ